MILRSFILLILLGAAGCQAQTTTTMEEKNNPLLCDPEKGLCEIPQHHAPAEGGHLPAETKPIRIVYFTDPICSSCWGIEPQLRRLKLEYGHLLEISYHMGGLLPDWSYNSGGISKPSDVAHHWDEVSRHYNMPIDGDVWLEDPLPSSYPPSIAFKAAQIQDPQKAIYFLRAIREMVFLEKKNITRWEHIAQAALSTGLDTSRLKQDFAGEAQILFRADLELGRTLGVRGFPTLLITDASGTQETVYGFKPYSSFEQAIRKLYPGAVKKDYDKSWEALFKVYPSLCTQEFAELSGLSATRSTEVLERLVTEKKLVRHMTRNGPIWRQTGT
jgi:putative protein-disulfide isomerase